MSERCGRQAAVAGAPATMAVSTTPFEAHCQVERGINFSSYLCVYDASFAFGVRLPIEPCGLFEL